MADIKDKRIPDVPQIETIMGTEKIPVSADGKSGYINMSQILDFNAKNIGEDILSNIPTASDNDIIGLWEDIN